MPLCTLHSQEAGTGPTLPRETRYVLRWFRPWVRTDRHKRWFLLQSHGRLRQGSPERQRGSRALLREQKVDAVAIAGEQLETAIRQRL